MSPAVASAFQPAGTQVLRIDELGGPSLGFVTGVSGGAISADVLEYQSGADAFSRKQPSAPHFEEIHVEVGAAMPTSLFDWIAASWGAKPPTHDGALLAVDHAFVVRSERRFGQALIAETSFPALDAATTDPGRIGIRITPAALEEPSSPNTVVQVPLGAVSHKPWQLSAFALTLDGLNATGVSRIEAFAVRRLIQTHKSGTGSPAGIAPGRLSFPNLRVRISAATASAWYAWHKDFVVDGHHTDADERSGAISLRAPNLVTELARIELHGVGILRVAEASDEDDPHPQGRVVADLYCQQMRLLAGTN